MLLIGPRVRLRDLTANDWPAVHAYSEQAAVTRYQPWGPNTPEQSRAFVEQAMAAGERTPRLTYVLAVTLAQSALLIGTATLTVHSAEHRQGEIGYALHADHWGHGYATEAARLLLDFGFAALALHRIVATCDPRNLASARVLQKLGMTHEGHHRETMRLRDGWRDSDLYSILEDEWRVLSARC